MARIVRCRMELEFVIGKDVPDSNSEDFIKNDAISSFIDTVHELVDNEEADEDPTLADYIQAEIVGK